MSAEQFIQQLFQSAGLNIQSVQVVEPDSLSDMAHSTINNMTSAIEEQINSNYVNQRAKNALFGKRKIFSPRFIRY